MRNYAGFYQVQRVENNGDEKMRPEEIDKILAEAANRPLPRGVDSATVRRAQAAILRDLASVRPLPPDWALTLGFLCLFAVFIALSALGFGLHGFRVLGEMQRALIFTTLVGVAVLAALACVREMRPAGGSPLGAAALAIAVVVFPVVFFLVFQNYSLLNLVKEGMPCLIAGLCVSIPAGSATAWILRRGFVLDWSAAGIAAGTLCGLAGLGMLELHCPNLKAIHVMLWHVAVVLISGALGFIAGRIASLRS